MKHEDYEREALKDRMYILEEEKKIIQEINEEEHRIPAKIEVTYIKNPEKQETNEPKSEPLPF